MKLLNFVSVTALAAALAACGSGDIEVDARNQSTTDNSVGDNSNNVVNEGSGDNTGTNPCASYEQDGETFQGSFDAPNCIYGSDFASLENPYTGSEELVFEDLANDGAHIFRDSLMIGRSFSNDSDLANAGISQGGDGSVLRLEAGVTLAFGSDDDFFVINRGSQIFAQGEPGAPITITSVSDIEGTVGPEDVREWGGMIINGFAVSNKCEYTGIRGEPGFEASGCHVEAEGREGAGQTFYGGDNDDDNSGILNYFMVKHTGAEVAPGNELNGITFNAIGRGTELSFIQAYSTFDDGIEFFGGAADLDHYVGVYVRDDSIDIDEGYIGTIDRALVIQSQTDGDHCVESDGIGSFSGQNQATIDDFIARGLNTRATIKNMTCIVSPQEEGTHAPGHGIRAREGIFLTIENSLVTTAHLPTSPVDNYCLRLDSEETRQAAADGDMQITQSIFACTDMIVEGAPDLPNGTSQLEFLQTSNDVMITAAGGEDPTSETNPGLQILDSFYSLPIGDIQVNGGAPTITPTEGRGYVGAVTRDDDWVQNWAYGIFQGNRGQALWIDELVHE